MRLTTLIPLCLLLLIALTIVFLRVARQSQTNQITQVYRQYGLIPAKNIPSGVQQALGAGWQCFEGQFPLQRPVQFNWWTKYQRGSTVQGVATFDYFLAVSFPPITVSETFVQQILALKAGKGLTVWQKIQDFFRLSPLQPIRTEVLEDGSLLIVWQVYDRAEYYEKKLTWLSQNLIIP